MTSHIKPVLGMPIEHCSRSADGRSGLCAGKWRVGPDRRGHRPCKAFGCGRQAALSTGRLSMAACCCSTRSASTPRTSRQLRGLSAQSPSRRGGTAFTSLRHAQAGSGDQSTSLGMGVLINGSMGFSETNQMLRGPGSVSYTFDNDATQLLQLVGGDTIELINNSVSSGPNAFTSVSMAVVRFDPGLKVLSAATRPT